jgi:hypothetical protein
MGFLEQFEGSLIKSNLPNFLKSCCTVCTCPNPDSYMHFGTCILVYACAWMGCHKSTCMGHDCNANNLHVLHSVKTCCDWQRSKHATEPGTVKVSPCFNYFSRISKLLQRLRSNATTLVLCQTVPLSQQKNRQTASMMKVHPRYVGKCVEQLVRNMTESKK